MLQKRETGVGGRDGVVMMVGGWVGIVVYGCSNLDYW